MQHPDFLIAGAGIIGLSLALELHRRGAVVTVLDQSAALAEASAAAAGMLAALDPENPPQLQPIADLSLTLYPDYLARIEALSDRPVPFQTSLTLQAHPTDPPSTEKHLPQLVPGIHGFQPIAEHSLDPRQLAAALLAAVQATTIQLLPHTPVLAVHSNPPYIQVQTPSTIFLPSHFIDCTGSWAITAPPRAVIPRKGQMLAVALPPSFPLEIVVRTPNVYIVPRTQGPNTGHAIIGATIEDRGFDKTVHPADITALHARATQLLPALASAAILESWAGLRPATRDGLPLLGPHDNNPRHLLATGHYRNGILLAPATAHLIAQCLTGEQPSLDLTPFAPSRLTTHLQ